MDARNRIQEHLDDNNLQEAITLFEQSSFLHSSQFIKDPSNFKFFFSLSKAYFISHLYQRCLNIIQSLPISTSEQVYELKLLEFKTKYLLNTNQNLSQILNQIAQYIQKNRTQFSDHHIMTIQKLHKFLQTRIRSSSKTQLNDQYEQFEKLKERQNQKGSFNFEGFPLFLVSRRWYDKWCSYVGHNSSELSHDHPGPISNFQITDHTYSLLYDPLSEKQYTNQQLFPSNQHVIFTKSMWKYLSSRYGGNEIKRFNISMLERLEQTLTEVWLKKIEVYRVEHGNLSRRYYVQITRKQNWNGLLKKLNRIWGKQKTGVIFKSHKTSIKKLSQIGSMSNSLEEEDISDLVIVFDNSNSIKLPKPQVTKPSAIALQRCANCHKTNKLSFCQCKTIKYCNMECLTEHRSKHRKDCEIKLQQESERNEIVNKFNLAETIRFGGKKGLCGLRNLGNTCYMNSGIQCLSNTKELTEYFMNGGFLIDLNVRNPLGSNGYVTCCYSKLVREIWSGSSGEVSPWELKKSISKFSPQFSGYGQHDSQELISTLIDGLHEDVNRIRVKPIIPSEEPSETVKDSVLSEKSWQNYNARNLSFISNLFTGQFKSTLKCPKCKRISISFDPFMLISLPIPLGEQIFLYFISRQLEDPAQRLDITIHPLETISDVSNKIRKILNISEDSEFLFVQIKQDYQIKAQFKPDDLASLLYKSREMIFCYEIPPASKGTLYKIKYLTNIPSYKSTEPSWELRSFPRYCRSQSPITSDMILHSIKRTIKSEPLSPENYFTYEITSNNEIKVYLKQNLKLASYKQTKTPQQIISINSCFNLFTKQQRLDKNNEWYCNKCKQHVEANKLMEIYNINQILVIGLKRFKLNRKIKCYVKFPINGLDMTEFVKGGFRNGSGSSEENRNKNERIIYDLYAVSNHYGSLGGGHYTAYCKNFINGKWYEFNDSRVAEVSESEVVSSNAYVLFYRRRQ